MKKRIKERADLHLERMFETRTDEWQKVGLAIDVNERAIKRARREAVALLLVLAGVLLLFALRADIFGKDKHGNIHYDTPITIATILAILVLGWWIARDIGRAAAPTFFRRMDPATAGTVGFIIRLITIAITVIAAFSIAKLPSSLTIATSAVTAVVVGLAAQQTLGNLFAGMILISARPFRVGERVRFQAGPLAGSVEGVVSSLGLLYTTLARGDDRTMIPNSVVMASAVVPIKEPDPVDVRVRLDAGISVSQLQAILDEQVKTPTRNPATVVLDEIDGDEVVVRVQAVPDSSSDGARLADEIIAALATVTGEHAVRRE